LGTWQVYRLQWKEGVLAQIAAAEAAPPAPLPPNPAPYTKGSVTGRFRFDRAAQFGAEVRDTRTGPTMGFHQIVPLEREGARTILVDRGWIPQKRETPLNDPGGIVTVTGYFRPGDRPHWFSPADDEAARQFYTLDPNAIGASVGVSDPTPFVLVAMGPPMAEAYPAPAQHLPEPPNNHLSYVITWYGLAVALLFIFGIWARKTLRLWRMRLYARLGCCCRHANRRRGGSRGSACGARGAPS
jgi:surfeit locus 1 family protein